MKTSPFTHQKQNYDLHAEDELHALLWEQGTGKSKTLIDHACRLEQVGRVNAAVVIAPNGVHENWLTDELPAHCWAEWRGFAWRSKSAGTKWHAAEAEAILKYPRMAWLLMSYEAFMTKKGRAFAEKFARTRDAVGILDESQRIKNAAAKRTRSIVAYGRRFRYKRIGSGTPVTNGPFDVYPQMKFLDETFWKRNGFASYESFKTFFGEWEERVNNANGQRFKQCVYFKNLDRLAEIVRQASTRVLKQEALDLPDKVYTKRYFDLTPEQRRLYEQLKTEFYVELENGEITTAPLAITRLLRFQQITCGYLPNDDCDAMYDTKENPRLTLLLDTLSDVTGKAIIFARFRRDVDKICVELGDLAVRYDGSTSDEDRLAARTRFQNDPEVRFFVGNPSACGTGLTLTAASTVIYYSNWFSLEQRLQSEDRAHRIGQRNIVTYVDLVASSTVDSHIVGALRNKRNIAGRITGDELKEWL